MPQTAGPEIFDVIIIGGGPSGLACATRLRQLGVQRVLVIERQGQLGGIPLQCDHTGFGIRHLRRLLTGPQYSRRLVQTALSYGVKCLSSTTVFDLDPEKKEVTCVSERGHEIFRAQAILIATGCRESTRSARLIPGYRGKGIYSTAEAQQYIHFMDTLPGKRVVVLGSEDVGLSAVYMFGKTKARIVGVIEEQPHLVSRWMFALVTLVPHRVPLFTGHAVKQIFGTRRVEGIEIIAIDEAGNGLPGTEKTIACDTVIVAGKFVPESALAQDSGVLIDDHTHGPVVDQYLQTEVPGIFASGNVLRGVETGDIAAMEGEWAADCIQRYLQDPSTFTGQRIIIAPGNQVKWTMPQRLLPDAPPPPRFLATLRVSERILRAQITCGQDGDIWRSGRFRALKPERRISLNLHKWPSRILQESVEVAVVK